MELGLDGSKHVWRRQCVALLATVGPCVVVWASRPGAFVRGHLPSEKSVLLPFPFPSGSASASCLDFVKSKH
jgi:hypothetical protein